MFIDKTSREIGFKITTIRIVFNTRPMGHTLNRLLRENWLCGPIIERRWKFSYLLIYNLKFFQDSKTKISNACF